MTQRNPMNERYTKEREGGATKRGAGTMKPASKAGASVRQPTKKPTGSAKQRAMATANMSKDERKAMKAKQREQENNLYTASSILCNKDAKYKKLRKFWWGLLIAAVVFTALSWATLSASANSPLSVVVLVLAYASIIGALVMDFTVVRKRRNVFRDKVNGMSKKAVDRIIEESYQERIAKEAAKKAKKEARKAGKSAAEADQAAQRAHADAMSVTKKKYADADKFLCRFANYRIPKIRVPLAGCLLGCHNW